MKKITKGTEPISLTQHRSAKHSNYDNYKYKDDLRTTLVRDQRGICCYCMGAILPNRNSMKIEHWECQEDNPDKELLYSNILGACMGNEGQPEKVQHCDTFKGKKVLSKNPSHSMYNIETSIQYSGDGKIKSTDKKFDEELNNVLNLNAPYLINQRKGVLTGFTKGLAIKGELKKPEINRLIRNWNGDDLKNTDTLKPYCQVIVYWLRKRLNRD